MTPPSSSRDLRDAAYACYLIVGLIMVATAIGLWLDLEFATADTEFGFWLYVFSAVVFFAAVALSISLWRDTRLRLLGVLAIVFLVAGMLVDVVLPERATYVTDGIFTLAALVLSVRWFAVDRRRFT